MENERPIVLIEWYDAKFSPGPLTHEEIEERKMSRFRSVGYLMSKDDVTTKIAMEYSDDGEYRDITLIPSGSIISVEKLLLSSSAPSM